MKYLRLKNSKRTSKCRVFFYSTRKTQKLDRTGALELKVGALRIFQYPFVATLRKNEGGLFEKKNRSHISKKTESGHPLVSPGIACYAEKEQFLYFSSLCQIVHFTPSSFVELCRKYFARFAWIEKQRRLIKGDSFSGFCDNCLFFNPVKVIMKIFLQDAKMIQRVFPF